MARQQIIEILNRDEHACKLMRAFKEAAQKADLTEVEYDSAHETVLMMAIAGNQEAMSAMASDVYSAINE